MADENRVNENHIRALVEGHALQHKGIQYKVILSRLSHDRLADAGGAEPRAVDLLFTATPSPGGKLIHPQLHLGIENAADDEYVVRPSSGASERWQMATCRPVPWSICSSKASQRLRLHTLSHYTTTIARRHNEERLSDDDGAVHVK
jgi:hypothetical protein